MISRKKRPREPPKADKNADCAARTCRKPGTEGGLEENDPMEVPLGTPMRAPSKGWSGQTDFHEKALSVKADVAAAVLGRAEVAL